MKLYHYTCSDHGAPGIRESGFLRPSKAWGQTFAPEVVWLTDLPFADADRLGLTARLLDCDRTEVGFVVETDDAVRWKHWKRTNAVPREWVRALESMGADPYRWFLCETSVPVLAEVAA